MTLEIIWLPAAQTDLYDIHRYVATRAGGQIAGNLIERVIESADVLAAFPAAGKQSGADANIRELQSPGLPYLLPYRVKDGRVEILRVFHEAQTDRSNGDSGSPLTRRR